MRSWERRIAFEEPDTKGSPEVVETIAEALRLDTSPTARAMFGRAASDAAADGAGLVGLHHLILAALQLGQVERTTGETQTLFAAAFTVAVERAAGLPGFIERIRGADVEEGRDLPLSPMAQSAIAQARSFARLSTSEDFVAARHLITALTFPLRPDLRAALKRVWKTRWGIEPEVLRPALAAAMERAIAERTAQGRQEDRAAWQSVFGTRRDAPAFATDAPNPAPVDPLGYAQEAQRLAELACLKSNPPPMTVALLGDWGSGKSTFMRRMQTAVEDIERTWRDDADAPFCGNRGTVKQIRFNAWAYGEGDIWAGLITEIFNALRPHLVSPEELASAAPSPNTLWGRLVRDQAAADATRAASETRLDAAQRTLDAKRDALAAVERREAEIVAAPAACRLIEHAERLLRTDTKQATAALAAVGVATGDQQKAIDSLVGEAREAASTLGKLRLLGRTLKGVVSGPDAIAWIAGAVIAAVLLYLLLPSLLAGGTWLAAIAGAVLVRAKPILALAATFEKAEAEERAAIAARRTTLEAELAEAKATRDGLRAARDAAAARAEKFHAVEKRDAPTLLRYFLTDDPQGLGAYEGRVSELSRLQAVFELLNAYLSDPALARAREEGRPAPVERVILYVDDLDRCQPNRVVEVLQVLALLLSMNLFVAVVAMDERWVKAALKIHYRELFEADAMQGPEQFLEKIFQVPFWLPPMQSGDINRFGAFVAHLVPEAVALPEKVGALATESGDTLVTETGQPIGASTPTIDPDELPQPGDTDPFAQASKADTVARVSLTAQELDVLSALAPVAGSTPRGVKRFVNLYRLIRAAYGGDALDRFLAPRDEAMPRFAVVALSLAMQCGLSQRTLNDMLYFVGELRDGTMEMDGVLYDWSRRFDPSAKVARPADRPAERPGLEEVGGIRAVAAYDQINLIRRSAKSLSERFGRKLRLADMTEAWPEAVRFSFNRPV